jgi:hypothetical protein
VGARVEDRLVKRGSELVAVRESGERVVVGPMVELLLRALPLRDVEDHALRQCGLAIQPRQDDRAIEHPADDSVG